MITSLRISIAIGLAAVLLAPTAQAAPKKAKLLKTWKVSGADPGGRYQGTLAVTDASGNQVGLVAKLTYADGRDRSWSATGRYLGGRIVCDYTIAPYGGITGRLNGTGEEGTGGSGGPPHISAHYVPNQAASSMTGLIGGPQGSTTEVLTPLAPTGKFVVYGDWDSFGEWRFELKDGKLVDSHTDDLPAKDWPTRLEVKGDKLRLTQRTEASDAILTEVLVLRVIPGPQGVDLVATQARSRYVDTKGEGTDSTTTQKNLRTRQPDGRVLTSARVPSGKFVVRGKWDSFREWRFELKDGKLVDSHTDDLPAKDWPTKFQSRGERIVLTQRTEASDAILIERLILQVVRRADGGLDLRAVAARTTTIDLTGVGDRTTITQNKLVVVQLDGREIR